MKVEDPVLKDFWYFVTWATNFAPNKVDFFNFPHFSEIMI